jgi:hypothetical protein
VGKTLSSETEVEFLKALEEIVRATILGIDGRV